MNRLLPLAIIFWFLCHISYAQDVEVLKIFKELESYSISRDFRILPKETKFMADSKLAQLSSHCRHDKESNLKNLFERFKAKALGMGGNCFVIDSVNHSAKRDMTTVIISVFILMDGVIKSKQKEWNANKVYLLGSMYQNHDDGRKIRINGEVYRIMSLQVLEYSVDLNEKFKVNLGGFFGQTRRITGAEKMPAMHLSFGGFSARPTFGYGYGYGVGIPGPAVVMKFSSGAINVIDFDMGQFYVQIMQTDDDYAR